jgi:ABC-type sugar transport system permease subunit
MIQQQLRKLIIPLLLPAVALHTVFFLIPVINAFYYSLTSWSGISPQKEFIGLTNYIRAFTDRTFIMALENIGLFGVLGFLLVFPMALFFAVILSRKPPFERFLKFVIFAPTLLSVVITAVLWGSIYNPVIGLLNETLRGIGLEAFTRPWLGSRHNALPAITVAMIWQGLGTYVILFLAGLQKIPRSIYESAELDGASAWQQFWHITLPLLWDVVHILVILWIVGAFQIFALIFIITRGYPNVIEVLGTYIYWAGFQGQSVGYASAMGVIMFLLALTVSLAINRLMRRETIQY